MYARVYSSYELIQLSNTTILHIKVETAHLPVYLFIYLLNENINTGFLQVWWTVVA